MGRTPERHVEPEEPVPEVVDRRRQDDDRHAPPRQLKAPRAAEPRDRDGARRLRTAPRAPRLEEEHAERDQGSDDDRRVRHDVRRDPEGIAPDDEVPADVPADAPAPDELRDEQRPERVAPEGHPHDVMIHCAPQ